MSATVEVRITWDDIVIAVESVDNRDDVITMMDGTTASPGTAVRVQDVDEMLRDCCVRAGAALMQPYGDREKSRLT